MSQPYQEDDERGVAPYAPAQLAPTPPTPPTPSSALSQPPFTNEQIALIKAQIAPDASDGELQLFIEVCRQTGLNPFMRQIYAISRSVKLPGKDATGRDKWGKRMTIQTGIDGYRLLAARTGQLAGIDDAIYDQDDPALTPGRATVTVWRWSGGRRCAFTATARWGEYAQTDKENHPTGLWPRMPYLMLAKCAEALALRKAFPAELSGIYTDEEMMQADNPPISYIEQAATADPNQATTDDDGTPPTAKQLSAIRKACQTLGLNERQYRPATSQLADGVIASLRAEWQRRHDEAQTEAQAPAAPHQTATAPSDLTTLPVGARGN